MSETLSLTIAYQDPDEEGWIVASVVQVPAAVSQGRTRAEARENVIDALRLLLSRTTTTPSMPPVAASRSS